MEDSISSHGSQARLVPTRQRAKVRREDRRMITVLAIADLRRMNSAGYRHLLFRVVLSSFPGFLYITGMTLSGTFLAASLILAITPGPGVIYIVTRSVSQGRRSGLASVAGVAVGNLANAVGASAGLAAIFAISSAAFSIVKLAGAGYLIFLGIQRLLKPKLKPGSDASRAERAGRIFRRGMIVAALNPKTAIFFGAFLPQFLGSGSHSFARSVLLGAAFVAIAAVTDTVYALGASAAAPLLTRRSVVSNAGRYVSGSVFIGLGIAAAVSGSRPAR